MNLAVSCPCLYPDRSYIQFADDSAARNFIHLRAHGVGEQFSDWKRMLIVHTLSEFKELMDKGFTHVLYVDGRDTVFVSDLVEIREKYLEYGAPPCLMSADEGNCFLNAGGYIAELHYMLGVWNELARRYSDNEGDYQQWVVKQWPIIGMELDVSRILFLPVDSRLEARDHVRDGRVVYNGVKPCILHFRGGYCDPKLGRYDRIQPWVNALWG